VSIGFGTRCVLIFRWPTAAVRTVWVNDGLELRFTLSQVEALHFLGCFFYFILHIKIAALCSNERKCCVSAVCLAEAKCFAITAKDTAHKSIQDITGLF